MKRALNILRHASPGNWKVVREQEWLPQLDKAYLEGRLSWSAVREITRVATRETESEWIAPAEEKDFRQVEQAVSRVDHGDSYLRA